jgi:gas vesicle protein GvpL/GvpF
MMYVYGLADRQARPLRAAGHAIEFVAVEGVYAVVEKRDTRLAVSEAALRTQHEIVRRIAARVEALLPARFGSLVDEAELAQVVRQRRSAIREALDLVRGREQMTVRVFTDTLPAARQAGAATGVPATTGTSYLQARRAVAAGCPIPDSVADIDAAVAHLVVARRAEPGQGHVAATLYHLIERGRAPAYLEALDPIRQRTLTVSGPWPPFAFVPELWP